jgi:hypothetical protein
MKFRIFTAVDCADTSRDPDDIHIHEVGVYNTFTEAIDSVEDYAKNHSLWRELLPLEIGDKIKIENNAWKWIEEDGWWCKRCGGSWGETLFIQPI